MFIILIYVIFLVGSCMMIPFAYLKSTAMKAQALMKANLLNEKIIGGLKLLCFIVFGIPILLINQISDFYYFWANNFRSNLKLIIIERQKSTLTNDSVRQLTMLCQRYSSQKIKSILSHDFVKTFRQKFLVIENIQYLLFGQMIGENNNNNMLASGGGQIKSLKTTNLRAYKDKVQELANTAEQIKKSHYEIDQYNQIKNALMNFSFDNKGTKTLAVEIIENVMDELRRERKICMVLADAEIEEYIKLDLSSGVKEDDEGISPFMKQVLIAKRMFREELCQKVSILRLGYMFKVLKVCHPGKATMLGAEAFMVKMKKLEKKDNRRKKF